MRSRSRLTKDIIDRVWSMHNAGHDNDSIAAKLKISLMSVQRCVTAFRIASSGQEVEYTGLFRDCHHIADYANETFKTQITKPRDLTAAVELLAEVIAKHTELIETIIKKLERKA